jgi:hypothetical protein
MHTIPEPHSVPNGGVHWGMQTRLFPPVIPFGAKHLNPWAHGVVSQEARQVAYDNEPITLPMQTSPAGQLPGTQLSPPSG